MSRARKIAPGDPLKAVAYLRTSKEEQKLGVEAQRSEIQTWAQTRHVTICSWQQEHISGGTDHEDRPGLVATLADIKAMHLGLVIMLRRDRLARDRYQAAAIERAVQQAGARIVTLDGVAEGEGPDQDFMKGMLDLFAEYERSMIRSRVKAALKVKKDRGEPAGHPPYGFRTQDGKLVPDERERATAKALLELRQDQLELRGKPRSLEWITKQAQAKGLVSRTGKPLSFSLVARIVRMAPKLTG